jgi:hypothetical protein
MSTIVKRLVKIKEKFEKEKKVMYVESDFVKSR